MRYAYKYIILLLCSASLFSCEQVIDLPLPEYESKLACYGILKSGENPRILVNESKSYFEPTSQRDKLGILENAEVIISTESDSWTLEFDTVSYYTEWYFDSVAGEWLQDSIPFGSYSTDAFIVENNELYYLDIKHNDRELNGSTRVPSASILSSHSYGIDTFTSSGFYEYTCLVYDFEFNISDPEGQNYYEIEWHVESWQTECIAGEDSCLAYENYYGTYTIEDNQNSEELSERLRYWASCSNPIQEPNPDFWSIHVFNIYSVSEETYAFKEAVEDQLNAEFNPFVEPIPLSNTVEGGIGLFGSVGQVGETIRIKTEY